MTETSLRSEAQAKSHRRANSERSVSRRISKAAMPVHPAIQGRFLCRCPVIERPRPIAKIRATAMPRGEDGRRAMPDPRK